MRLESADTPTPATVAFPHRARRGVLLGLSVLQLAVATATTALLLAVLMAKGLGTALLLTPLWAAAAALALARYRSRPLADWAPVAARYLLRRWRGQLVWLAHPTTRPVHRGMLHLPGTAASLRAYTSPDAKFGAVHDPHQGTLTATARITSRAYALLDPATQNANVAGWGRVLSALARSGQVARVQVMERTVPDSGDALQRYWSAHQAPSSAMASGLYQELLQVAGPAAAPHEAYLSIALDLKAARQLVRQAGGGLAGAFTVLAQLTASVEQSLRDAGLTLTGWLSDQQIAAVIRTAYDPGALAALEHRSAGGQPQADPAAAGPVIVLEKTGTLRTDTARHAVFWAEEWPRTQTNAGFLHGITFSSGIRRTLSLIYTPYTLDAALKDVRRSKASIISNANERARKGQVDSEEDRLQYSDVKVRERQLLDGHSDVSVTGLLVVSADSDQELNAACARIKAAASNAGVGLRLLELQQAEAFTAAALPLARP